MPIEQRFISAVWPVSIGIATRLSGCQTSCFMLICRMDAGVGKSVSPVVPSSVWKTNRVKQPSKVLVPVVVKADKQAKRGTVV